MQILAAPQLPVVRDRSRVPISGTQSRLGGSLKAVTSAHIVSLRFQSPLRSAEGTRGMVESSRQRGWGWKKPLSFLDLGQHTRKRPEHGVSVS